MNSDRIQGAARDVGGKVQQTFGMATGDGQMRAEGVAREVAGKGQNLYGQAVDGLRDAADRATDYAEEAYERGGRYLHDGTRAVESRINQHPLTGIVLAGALGFVLGMVVSNRR
jgi:uncharacterized protein YjbJ (UPF0337 family)